MAIKYASLQTLRAFQQEVDSRYLKVADLPVYGLEKLATATEGYLASYQFTKDGVAVGDKVNLPKDLVIKSATLETVTEADSPEAGYVVGDRYIDMIVNTVEGDGQATHIYVNVKDLVDNYTAGDGIDVTNNVISLKIKSGSALSVDAETGELQIATVSATTPGVVTPEMMTKWNNSADSQLSVGTPTGEGNVISSLSVNASGELIADKGVIALQESDLIEITNAEVTALWEGGSTPTPTPTKYTVTFNSNEGSPIDSQEVEEGKKITKPANPTKDGNDFGGWFSDSELTTPWDFENGTVSAAMTLYAKWDATP